MSLTRLHTNEKEVLRFENLDLKELGMEEHADFMSYIDDIQYADLKVLSENKWKKLFAIIRNIAQKTERNYCIYQNKWEIYFDVTSHCLGTEEEIVFNKHERELHTKESALDKLKRYKNELEQIRLKIKYLRTREQEYVDKIEPLKAELLEVLNAI